MKVLVYFAPNKRTDNFEGVRLRKCIKGALEIAGVNYTTYIGDEYDVAHFISPKDEGKINEVISNDIPVVISALYCESDPSASWLDYKSNKKQYKILADPSNKDFIRLNLDELRKMI